MLKIGMRRAVIYARQKKRDAQEVKNVGLPKNAGVCQCTVY